MTNTEISNNNPEKELKIDNSISVDKTKQISKRNTTQNKKITPKNDKSNKSFDEISNEIFRDLVSKKDSLVKEIKELETKKNEIEKDIESNFNYVRIKGEISEVKTATRGQIYLTLKDEDSILSGVIWDQKKKYLDINPEIGLEIIATGRITTWSRYKTTYQIDIDKIEIAGEGALLKLIEERKKRLQKKGYFDEDKKIPLPFLPERLGIITSPLAL